MTATKVTTMIAKTAAEMLTIRAKSLLTSGDERGLLFEDCVAVWVGIGVPLGVDCGGVDVQVIDKWELVQ